MLFPALLRFWRDRRGLSQLDLALHAGVSARHISFLESGRAKPSEGMALRLLAALELPLRDQNEALRSAGFDARFPETTALPPEIEAALNQMLAQQEPYPLLVLAPDYTVLKRNRAATRLFEAFSARPPPDRLDMITLLFDPSLLRGAIDDWESLARLMLTRLHRQSLSGSPHAAALLERAFAFPDVPRAWRQPDFTRPAEASFRFRVRRGKKTAAFLNTITVFSAPQHVALEELVIESSFPLDDATRTLCRRLAG